LEGTGPHVIEWIVIELLPVILQCSFLEAD
jgi:hypothetical protein